MSTLQSMTPVEQKVSALTLSEQWWQIVALFSKLTPNDPTYDKVWAEYCRLRAMVDYVFNAANRHR